jgi:hypothetical protein
MVFSLLFIESLINFLSTRNDLLMSLKKKHLIFNIANNGFYFWIHRKVIFND